MKENYAKMMIELADTLPEAGMDDDELLAKLSGIIESSSAPLGHPTSFAHMDPAPPSIAVETTRLNAQVNQNLLHPSLSPFATNAEDKVIDWLLPFFGMSCGHMCGGSTIANLTALWSAREHGATSVVASQDAHISVEKAARILGMSFRKIGVDRRGKLNASEIDDVSSAALVLTAGTTGRGAIDPLTDERVRSAKWIHVDAAWAGPLRLTKHRQILSGIENADSIAISAHKWFFQPKDSAIVLFSQKSHQDPIAFGSSYLAKPNIGVQGSRGAVGVTLLATLLSWGRKGLAQRVERCMAIADDFVARLGEDPRVELLSPPETGVVNWRPINFRTEDVLERLPDICSTTAIGGEVWFRNVSANPSADLDLIWSKIDNALAS